MILCPHETIISKSEADFDTQRRRRAPRALEGSVATLLRLPNRFAPLAKVCVVTHFIIVGRHDGRLWVGLLPTVAPLSKRLPWAKGAHEARALWAKQREVSPMRAKETAQPVAAIAVDEPSEAGSTASELANDAERPC